MLARRAAGFSGLTAALASDEGFTRIALKTSSGSSASFAARGR
jgi:hypothetical protein